MLILDDRGEFGLFKPLAIRYLGGIMDISTFWAKDQYKLQGFAAKRLFTSTADLVEDTGYDSLQAERSSRTISQDIEGIDLLANSILTGVHGWLCQKVICDVRSECWSSSFLRLVNLLKA